MIENVLLLIGLLLWSAVLAALVVYWIEKDHPGRRPDTDEGHPDERDR